MFVFLLRLIALIKLILIHRMMKRYFTVQRIYSLRAIQNQDID